VEALEKVIRFITGSLTPAEQAELGVVSVKDLQADLRSIAFEAMKAAQEANPAVKDSLTDAPAGSLVERVMVLLGHHGDGTARAALREVAAWLRSEYPRREGYGTAWADLIEQEASR
jgi:hypothetical protein